MNTLKAINIGKSYNKRRVLHNISIETKSGQVVGILGPNGAGKTTLFYSLAGLVQADTGHCKLNNRTLNKLPIHKRSKLGIGYLPQESSIFQGLTVAQNIYAVLELRTNLDQKQREQKLQELLEEFHLEHLKNDLGVTLSGGERRRTEIARCLALPLKFLLLDEPFAGIDPISIHEIKTTIAYLTKKNIGIIITDHNVRDTLSICDTCYVIVNGTILAQGIPEDIMKNKQVREIYLGDHNA